MHNQNSTNLGMIFLLIIQFIFLLIFWIWGGYSDEILPITSNLNGTKLIIEDRVVGYTYSQYQDVQAMIFLGFAFLMTFLKKYGYSATGYTLLVSVITAQLTIILKQIPHLSHGYMKINLDHIIEGNIAAAVPLISMGVLLGRTTPIQLAVMAIIETFLYVLNEWLQFKFVCITDLGGSITVHAFGAYFGLAASLLLRSKLSKNKEDNNANVHDEPSTYTSDIFAILGSLILWIYWPSFNSILADGGERERAAVNTFLSLCAATVTTFSLSTLLSKEKKFDMVHIQNSTLAGGVAVGTVCNLLIGPHGAILIGITAGTISVIGYRFISPFLEEKINLQDTCGVHNLHGMPGILSSLFSVLYAILATKKSYKDSLTTIFPAMGSATDGTFNIIGGLNRSALQQGGYQAIGILTTVLIAIIGGALTGLILKTKLFRNLEQKEHNKDEPYWLVPDDMKEE